MLTDEQKLTLRVKKLNELMIACIGNDDHTFNQLLETEPELINQFSLGTDYPPLIYALKQNNVKFIKKLVENNANVIISCPLLAYEGTADDLGQAINHYPNVHFAIDSKDPKWTPLMFAGQYCDQEIIDLLLSKSHDFENNNDADDAEADHLMEEADPLMEQADHLVEEAEHYVSSIGDFFAWQAPFLYNKPELGHYLKQLVEQYYDLEQRDINRLLIQCLLLKQYDSMNFLISEYQADINYDINAELEDLADDDKIHSGLCSVLRKKKEYDLQLFNFLLEKGANINDEDHWHKMSALAWAAKRAYVDIVDRLLTHSKENGNHLNINAPYIKNDDGTYNSRGYLSIRTALMNACEEGHVEIVDRLLAHGAAVDLVSDYDDGHKTALMLATTNNRTDIVDRLLAHGADSTLIDSNGNNALMLACQNGHIYIVDRLLEHNIHGDNIAVTRNRLGQTPLMIAAQNNQLACLDRLVVTLIGSDIDQKDNAGNTALMLACENKHIDIVSRLIYLGANIHAINHQGYSPVTIAFQLADNEDIQKLLLKKDILDEDQINQQTILYQQQAILHQQQLNPLMVACCQNDIEFVKLLLSETKININSCINGRTYTALIYACIADNSEIVSLLLENGANPNQKNTLLPNEGRDDFTNIGWTYNETKPIKGWTAIMFASKYSGLKIINLLLNKGANLNDKARHYCNIIDSFSAWQMAYYYNRADIGEYFRGLVDPFNKMDKTIINKLINHCIYLKKKNSISALINQSSTDINAHSADNEYDENNPLFYAIDTHDHDFFNFLVQQGADVNLEQDLDTPLTKAAEVGDLMIINSLLDNGAYQKLTNYTTQIIDAFMIACQYGHADIVDKLVNNNLLGNMSLLTDKTGQTGFMLSCKYGHVELAQKLVMKAESRQQMVLSTDRFGETAFMKACQYGHTNCIDFLLSLNYIDINQTCLHGNTALMKASANGRINNRPEENRDDKYSDVVRKLINSGANTNAVNHSGDSVLVIACRNGNKKIVEQLLSYPLIDLNIVDLDKIISASSTNEDIKDLLTNYKDALLVSQLSSLKTSSSSQTLFSAQKRPRPAEQDNTNSPDPKRHHP